MSHPAGVILPLQSRFSDRERENDGEGWEGVGGMLRRGKRIVCFWRGGWLTCVWVCKGRLEELTGRGGSVCEDGGSESKTLRELWKPYGTILSPHLAYGSRHTYTHTHTAFKYHAAQHPQEWKVFVSSVTCTDVDPEAFLLHLLSVSIGAISHSLCFFLSLLLLHSSHLQLFNTAFNFFLSFLSNPPPSVPFQVHNTWKFL